MAINPTTDGDLTYQGRSLKSWLEQLDHADEGERGPAAEVLTNIAVAAMALLPALAAVLKQTSGTRRALAAAAIGQVGMRALAVLPSFRDALRSAVLTDRDEHGRAAALQALDLIGPQTASQLPALVQALRDELP